MKLNLEKLRNTLRTTLIDIWEYVIPIWKISGLFKRIKSKKEQTVIDIGCGYNEFKGKIKNLIGIDPYNDRADIDVHTLDYKPDIQFDVAICLGSINLVVAIRYLLNLKM